MILIYKVTSPNSKVYIGQTCQKLKARWASHVCQKGCIKLHNAINKYGKNNFKLEVLTVAHTQEVADYCERYFIVRYDSIKSGYNIKDGGANGKPSAEARLKMSISGKKKKLSEEHKRKIGLASKGRKYGPRKCGPVSAETGRKISIALTGIKRSAETRKKQSESKMGIAPKISRDILSKTAKNQFRNSDGTFAKKPNENGGLSCQCSPSD